MYFKATKFNLLPQSSPHFIYESKATKLFEQGFVEWKQCFKALHILNSYGILDGLSKQAKLYTPK